MSIYGYVRVSTKTQRLDRQINNINKWAGDRKIIYYKEKYTGTKLDRPQFQAMLNKLKSGDAVVFDSVSRMSRTAEDGYNLYMELMGRGIELIFLNEPHINTSVYKSMQQKQLKIAGIENKSAEKLVNAILEALATFQNEQTAEQIRIAFEQAEKEVIDLHKRISDGISATKEKNKQLPKEERKQIGREKDRKYETKKSKEIKEKMSKHLSTFGGLMSDKEFIETYKIGRNAFYKYKRELLEAMAEG